MTLPLSAPRTHCVYCGRKLSPTLKLPARLACSLHAGLIALDPEYAGV